MRPRQRKRAKRPDTVRPSQRGQDRLARAALRLLLEPIGWLMLLGGLVAIPLPGPGLPITFAGLLLLSRQYDWAARRVQTVRQRARQGVVQSVATLPRLTLSIAGAVLVLLAGILWIASPAPPSWWPVAQRWWLPGGALVGVMQLASSVFALAFLGYGFVRFHDMPEPPAAVTSDLNRCSTALKRLLRNAAASPGCWCS